MQRDREIISRLRAAMGRLAFALVVMWFALSVIAAIVIALYVLNMSGASGGGL